MIRSAIACSWMLLSLVVATASQAADGNRLVYLDQSIATSLDRAEPVVAISNDIVAVYASNAFWQLLDLYREASNRRRDLYSARDYASAVWKSASTGATAADAYVSTPPNHR